MINSNKWIKKKHQQMRRGESLRAGGRGRHPEKSIYEFPASRNLPCDEYSSESEFWETFDFK